MTVPPTTGENAILIERVPSTGQPKPEKPGRIGIVALEWNHNTGYGRFCRELVSALLRTPTGRRFTILTTPDAALPAGAEAVRLPMESGSSMRTVASLARLAWTIRQIHADLWFFPSPLHFVPVLGRAEVVLTIHDIIPWRYPGLIFHSQAQWLAWAAKLHLAMRQAARLVTVSDNARKSIAQHFQRKEDAIAVVKEAPAAIFQPIADRAGGQRIRASLGLPERAKIVIYHGALAPHKNLPSLVRAFSRISREPGMEDIHLVLIGSPSGSSQPEFQALRELCRQESRIKFPGALDDQDLVLALNSATIAVLPSLEEGFGLTGLEAAACGIPVIATRRSALPEVLSDAAAYFEPGNEPELYSLLKDLLLDDDRRLQMRQKGLERVAALGWDREAAHLSEIFDAVLARHADKRFGETS